ncbi:DNA polymerase [Brachybacterium sp. NPDC056505]|jgi:DNA polymerase-1|uniref:DNA polymerase n=1 Tax=Brachybacterium sp. NPDC056505 TaxID=3345843 RepID=UPI00366B098D
MSKTIVYFDLETADAERLWDYGPGFVRIASVAVNGGDAYTTTDIDGLVELLHSADLAVAHNGLGFDLLALERYHGLDLARLVEEGRVLDTLLVVRQNDPPLPAKVDGKRYDLDSVCKRMGIGGKLASGDGSVLKKLAREHGGYDRIPVDHPDYLAYALEDVELLRELCKRLAVDDYCWRETHVMYRLSRISKYGFRVDVPLAERLIAEQDARVEALKQELHERYGLPLTGKKPQLSKAGKTALEAAFRDCGVEPPLTDKGNFGTGKELLDRVLEENPGNERLASLCMVLRSMNGERSVAGTIHDCTKADGRVHPHISAEQGSGRISVTKPGLTVFGKRDRKNGLERALLLPDEGDVLIGADLSQIDARAMAVHSQDEGYIAALEPGKDLHDEMAAAVFGESGWDRSAGHHPRRGEAKAITHATSYGMGAAGLAKYAGCTLPEAEAQLTALAVQFPKLDAYKRFIRDEGRRQVLENAFGRRMRVEPGKEHTKAPASMGQGTARDLLMEGILRLPTWLLRCLRAIIHDEIILSVPEARADEAETAVLGALQFPYLIEQGALEVPVLAGLCDRGRDWADCYRTDHAGWPEIAWEHRQQPTCDDADCTWHTAPDTTTNAA